MAEEAPAAGANCGSRGCGAIRAVIAAERTGGAGGRKAGGYESGEIHASGTPARRGSSARHAGKVPRALAKAMAAWRSVAA